MRVSSMLLESCVCVRARAGRTGVLVWINAIIVLSNSGDFLCYIIQNLNNGLVIQPIDSIYFYRFKGCLAVIKFNNDKQCGLRLCQKSSTHCMKGKKC